MPSGPTTVSATLMGMSASATLAGDGYVVFRLHRPTVTGAALTQSCHHAPTLLSGHGRVTAVG